MKNSSVHPSAPSICRLHITQANALSGTSSNCWSRLNCWSRIREWTNYHLPLVRGWSTYDEHSCKQTFGLSTLCCTLPHPTNWHLGSGQRVTGFCQYWARNHQHQMWFCSLLDATVVPLPAGFSVKQQDVFTPMFLQIHLSSLYRTV